MKRKLFRIISSFVGILCMTFALTACGGGGFEDDEAVAYAKNRIVTKGTDIYAAGNIRIKKTATSTRVDEMGTKYVTVVTEEYAPAYGYAMTETETATTVSGLSTTKYLSAEAFIIQRAYIKPEYNGNGSCGHYKFEGYLDGATVFEYATEKWSYEPYLDLDADGVIDDINTINTIILDKVSRIYEPIASVVNEDFSEDDLNPGSYLSGTNFNLYYSDGDWTNVLSASRLEVATQLFKNKYFPKTLMSTNKNNGVKCKYEWAASAYNLSDVISDPFAMFYTVNINVDDEPETPVTPTEPTDQTNPEVPSTTVPEGNTDSLTGQDTTPITPEESTSPIEQTPATEETVTETDKTE